MMQCCRVACNGRAKKQQNNAVEAPKPCTLRKHIWARFFLARSININTFTVINKMLILSSRPNLLNLQVHAKQSLWTLHSLWKAFLNPSSSQSPRTIKPSSCQNMWTLHPKDVKPFIPKTLHSKFLCLAALHTKDFKAFIPKKSFWALTQAQAWP